MATIILHAGMPKTGSTSVQRWVIDNAPRLRQQHGIVVLVAKSRSPHNPAADLRLEPFESGDVNSGEIIKAWLAAERSPALALRFVEDLSRFADHASTVLVTAEALSQVFWRVDEPFLLAFEKLARHHDVRVAYYVRPQHTALEAGWREGGYKEPRRGPSEWVVAQSQRGLHYLPTLDAVRKIAPNVALEMRPFLPELLDGTSPVEDFVRRFLSLDEVCRDLHVNPGLPLELVNLLRLAPEGWFWTRANVENYPERYPRWKFTALFDDLEIRESTKIRRSRRLLQQYCHEVFEQENQTLIRCLEWPIQHFVPPVDELDRTAKIGELDALWQPDASQAERALLYHALRAALT